jgi:hypothetical protein
MQDKQLNIEIQNTGRPIGGWLWVIMLMILVSGLQIFITVVTTISELLLDDWRYYFQPTDELLRTRINLYLYLIISMAIGIAILVWSLFCFFNVKRNSLQFF